MEPLGTVTMYAQYLEQETSDLLATLMEESTDFQDFVTKLCDEVCFGFATPSLVYVTTMLSFQLYDYKNLRRLASKHSDVQYIKPILQYARSFLGETVDYIEVLDTAEKILLTSPPPWIAFAMQHFRGAIAVHNLRGSPVEEESLESMENLLRQHPDLDCFSSYLYDARAWRAVIDGNTGEALQFAYLAMETAKQHDNRLHLSYMLRMAAFIEKSDFEKTTSLLREARTLAEELGDQQGLANILSAVADMNWIQGEYESAIDLYLRVINIREKREMPLTTLPLDVSRIYNEVGDGENALEWLRMAEDCVASRPHVIAEVHLERACTLAQLNRIEEATAELSIAKPMALEGGFESQLGYFHFAEGVLEKEMGLAHSALENFEQALEIGERLGRQQFVNSCLLKLTEIELALAKESGKGYGKLVWLSKLLETAEEMNLDGILGYGLVIKAIALHQEGKSEEANKKIERATRIAERPGMGHLKMTIQDAVEDFSSHPKQ